MIWSGKLRNECHVDSVSVFPSHVAEYGRGGLRQSGRRCEEGREGLDRLHCSPLQSTSVESIAHGKKSTSDLKLKLKLDDRR